MVSLELFYYSTMEIYQKLTDWMDSDNIDDD